MIEISVQICTDFIDIKIKMKNENQMTSYVMNNVSSKHMYVQHWSKPPQPVLEDPEDAKKKKGGAAKPDPKKKK